MPLKFISQDLGKIRADVIVYPADPLPAEDHEASAALRALNHARMQLGEMSRGDVRFTEADGLHAKYIFHTVRPLYTDGSEMEVQVFRNIIRRCLKLAAQLECETIVFVMSDTDSSWWPQAEALRIVREVLLQDSHVFDLHVTMALSSEEDAAVDDLLLQKIHAYIEQNIVTPIPQPMYSAGPGRRPMKMPKVLHSKLRAAMKEELSLDSMLMPEDAAMPDLDRIIAQASETFQERLFRLIDERGMEDPDVYRRANIDRRLFSKIRGDRQYRPSKENVIAFCLALELNIDDASDLMRRAGYAFSPSRKKDLILKFCIEQEVYNLMDVNEILFRFDEKCI